ncbi:endonuclease V [Microscilla marina]|uniref:Endonuclease V n=1 Tax=Microscilla marina ATCC 23134 TaxID=313606 RepID=A1ZQQ2_MICM2|nr:endonuclease V [Microscilla marina]EAY27207.1 endonuclease V [Microscilla marina ATCC 23134]
MNDIETQWANEQRLMAAQVQIPTLGQGYQPQDNDVILGLDIQYESDKAYIAGDLQHYNGHHLGTYSGVTAVMAPYVPGFFCFREGPPLFALVNHLLNDATLPRPDLLVVDGHGIAHPRTFGVACWLGVKTGLPTIGIAKKSLLKFSGQVGNEQGSILDIAHKGQVVGYALRTQTGIKPEYVSPGHLVALDTAKTVALNLVSEYRIPDVLRRADQMARLHSKDEQTNDWINVGTLG